MTMIYTSVFIHGGGLVDRVMQKSKKNTIQTKRKEMLN